MPTSLSHTTPIRYYTAFNKPAITKSWETYEVTDGSPTIPHQTQQNPTKRPIKLLTMEPPAATHNNKPQQLQLTNPPEKQKK